MLVVLVEVILPVVLVAAVGVVLARTFALDPDTLGKVNLYALAPALAFSSLLRTTVSADVGLRLALAYVAVTAVAAALAFALAAREEPGTRRGVVACTILGNNGNFGLPIALLALGRPGLDQAVLIFVYSLVVMFTVGPALLGAHTGLRGAVRTVLLLPVTWALLAALVVKAGDLHLPVGVTRGVDLLADAAVPLVLLSLGVQLGQSDRVHLTRPVLTAVSLRVVAVPLLGLGVGWLCGLRGLPLESLVLACAMPTAVNTFMLAREYGSAPDTVASAVALSTLVSIGTIAFVVTMLPSLG